MNAMTQRPPVTPGRLPAGLSPDPEEPRLAENVYRIVCALRADPRFADEALSPDAYLAALDNPTAAGATKPHTPEEQKS